jgi:hypothetical protein
MVARGKEKGLLLAIERLQYEELRDLVGSHQITLFVC